LNEKLEEPTISLFMYFYTEEDQYKLELPGKSHRKGISPGQFHLRGYTPQLGNFSIFIKEDSNQSPQYSQFHRKFRNLPDLEKFHFLGSQLNKEELWKVKDHTLNSLRKHHHKVISEVMRAKSKTEKNEDSPLFIPTLSNLVEEQSNIYVVQRILKVPFEIDIVLLSYSAFDIKNNKEFSKSLSNSLFRFTGSVLTQEIDDKYQNFEQRFEKTFHLAEKKIL